MSTARGSLVSLGASLSKHSLRLQLSAPVPTVTARALPHLQAIDFSHYRINQRRMSSSNSKKKEWMALVPDHANALEKRLAVRAEHFSRLQPSVDSQTVLLGGCTFKDHHPSGDETGDMNGSFIIIQAESEAEARAWIKNDIYTKSGVWNADAAQIWPFKSAIRTQK